MDYLKSLENYEEKAKINYIKEYDEPYYTARDLYDRRQNLTKIKNLVSRITRELNKDPRVFLKNRNEIEAFIAKIHREINTEIELIKFTESIDKTSDEKTTVFTGVKAVWYDKPLKELIEDFYNGDINEFYHTIENMGNSDEIRTNYGAVPKNLALQFIQALRLISSEGSVDRYNRGIFKIHHDLQIAPTHIVDILEILGYSCRPTCVMEKSESEFEKGIAPQWIINLANKPYERDYSEPELTEEEKRIFAKVGKTEIIVVEGGCTCGHNKSDHASRDHVTRIINDCKIKGCKCNKFKLRMNTKRTIEI